MDSYLEGTPWWNYGVNVIIYYYTANVYYTQKEKINNRIEVSLNVWSFNIKFSSSFDCDLLLDAIQTCYY